MEYKAFLIAALKRLDDDRFFLDNSPEQLKSLDNQIHLLKTSAVDLVRLPNKGRGKQEDFLLGSLVERDALRLGRAIVKRRVDALEAGLDSLDAQERGILTDFYVDPISVEAMSERYGYAKSALYSIKDEALRKLAHRMYGHSS